MKKGEKHSPEWRAKMRIANAGTKNPMWGRPVSKETRAKLRIAMLGRKFTPEWRAKITATKMGHSVSEETRVKQSIAHVGKQAREKNPMWGKHPSAETKEKNSAAHLGKHLGDKSPRWRGGRIETTQGYEAIRIHPRFYLATHRLVMERILGRKLQKGEVVHHINRNRKDNRPENLALCNNTKAHGWCATEEAKVFLGAA